MFLIIHLSSQGTEIQRVWSLHNVLLTLDYTSEDNQQITDLLLQCFQRPIFIRNDDVSRLMHKHRVWFSHRVFHCFICEPSAWWCVYCHRESDSWYFFSVGISISSVLFMELSRTSWSFTASKTLTLSSLRSSVLFTLYLLLKCFFRTMTTHIMEVYFRAWKKASGDFQEQIESSCIQDFMQNAIFLHRSSPVHSKVRQVD